jgi:hypothetical protein
MVSAGQVHLPLVMSLLFALPWPTQSAERSTEDIVQTSADGLERSQIKSGPLKGSWLYEEYFAAPSTAGLVAAYEWLGKTTCNNCACRADYCILVTSDPQTSQAVNRPRQVRRGYAVACGAKMCWRM